jgi:hypothetical protein
MRDLHKAYSLGFRFVGLLRDGLLSWRQFVSPPISFIAKCCFSNLKHSVIFICIEILNYIQRHFSWMIPLKSLPCTSMHP